MSAIPVRSRSITTLFWHARPRENSRMEYRYLETTGVLTQTGSDRGLRREASLYSAACRGRAGKRAPRWRGKQIPRRGLRPRPRKSCSAKT